MEQARRFARERYGLIATQGGGYCSSSCCRADAAEPQPAGRSGRLGYADADLASVPKGSNPGLVCGNPHLVAWLQGGETVLDLGSGGGLDFFLAARKVGITGHVIGVDMTAEMVSLARKNLSDVAVDNVDFRLGEIEHLPVADRVVDVIMSNCVVNLSPDKAAVFKEAMRVLKPGGRLAMTDVVATVPEITDMRSSSGFVDIRITPLEQSDEILKAWEVRRRPRHDVVSATIEARKPA